MTEEQLAWVCAQSEAAVANGEVPVGINHFAIIPHFAVQAAALKLFCVNDWQRIAGTLADSGMHYVFTGHQHAPDVASYTSANGESIYDCETGSLSNYSNTYRENYLERNANGSIDFDTVSRDCDTAVKVDLSKCWYEYDDSGNPVFVDMQYNTAANGKPFGSISKPFAENYGIYLFAGTRLDATDTGDCIVPAERPSLTKLATNMVSGYLDGRLIDDMIRSGGAKALVESVLGTDIKSFLDANFPGDSITVSIITLKKEDIINVIDMIADELDNSLLGYLDGEGNVVRKNQDLIKIINNLIKELLDDYKIAGHSLGEIAMAAVVANYDCRPIDSPAQPQWIQDLVADLPAIYAEIDSDVAIRNLADHLVNVLLGQNVTTDDGEGNETTEWVEGDLVKLLRTINLSTDMVDKVLPDFAGVLRYPAVRKLLFGTTSKTPDIVSIVDAWAGRIISDPYSDYDFSDKTTESKKVSDTASLAKYFLFGLADDYLTDDQIHAVSELLNYALQSFFIDPTSTEKANIPYTDHYPFIDNYDLKSEGLMTGDDYKATINYQKLSPKAAEDAWYQIPDSVSVSFGSDPTTTKNINWFTIPQITGNDIQIIEHNPNATAADFAGGSNVYFEAQGICNTIQMTYPNLDIGVYNVGESMSMNRHTVKVTKLLPGVKYTYRVGDAAKNIWSKPATLETASGNSDAYSFLYLTDTQSQTKAQYEESFGKILADAKSKAPEYKFILHTGDFVDSGSNMSQWSWGLGLAGIADTTIASTAGNHEPKGTNGKEGLLTTAFGPAQDTFFAIDHVDQDVSDGIYYDFDYNDVHVMVLNTNNLGEDKALSDEQVAWLKQSAESSTKTWNVVAMHKSIYSNASHFDDSDVVALRKQLQSLMPELGIDVVFSGHDHVFVRTEFMTDGSVSGKFDANNVGTKQAGTVYLINGKAGVKDYNLKSDEKVKEMFDLDSMKRADTMNKASYSIVSVDAGSFKVETYQLSEDGSTSTKIDTFIIEKGKLDAPTLKAEVLTKTANKLSWNAVDGANTYQLYRSEARNGVYEKIATLSATSYKDTGLTTGKTYYYKVVAGTGSSASNASNIVLATPAIPAVRHLKVNNTSATSVQTSWSKVDGAKAYNLYMSTEKGDGYELVTSTSAIEYKVTGLTKGTTYYFKVCATDGTDEGASSYIVRID